MTISTATKRKKHPDKAKLDDFIQKCRDSVKNQIVEFKASKLHPNGYYYSDLTGYKIRNSRKAQCNHVIPFRELVYNFIRSRKIDLNDINSLPESELTAILKDFAAHHERVAVLNILTESENKRDFYTNREKFRHWTEFYIN
ncbi:hypothetical protein [Nostoc sp.]|uniref:hypothetical protein n=1 Tax=Nostoc sp. TaxID=1180 RepID=UPI002FF5C75D